MPSSLDPKLLSGEMGEIVETTCFRILPFSFLEDSYQQSKDILKSVIE